MKQSCLKDHKAPSVEGLDEAQAREVRRRTMKKEETSWMQARSMWQLRDV